MSLNHLLPSGVYCSLSAVLSRGVVNRTSMNVVKTHIGLALCMLSLPAVLSRGVVTRTSMNVVKTHIGLALCMLSLPAVLSRAVEKWVTH